VSLAVEIGERRERQLREVLAVGIAMERAVEIGVIPCSMV
jgi:hypothetical protein